MRRSCIPPHAHPTALSATLPVLQPGRLSELRGRFDAALATLRAIPPCLQTDLTLRVFALTTAAAGGALAALRSAVVVTETAPPSDIVFSAPSGSQRRRVRPGTAVAFRIAATPDASMRLHHDAEAFAAAVAQRVWAAATLTAPSKALGAAARVTIHIEAVVDIVRDAASGEPCVHVAFTVPAEATLGSTLKLHCLNLAAHPLLPSEGASFTVVPSVGLRVPLDVPRLCVSRNQTPCTSRSVRRLQWLERRAAACRPLLHPPNSLRSDGSLWIPGLSEVQRIADDGSTLQVFPTAPLGLSGMLCAVFDHETGLIVIASQNPGLPLIAVRASTGGTAWRATEAPGAVFGLAVLSAAGVVVVGGYSAEPDAISVHRLSDGARLATASVRGMTYLTADQATGAVYASTSRGTIEVLKWDGRALVAVGPFRLAPHLPANTSHNPLCIMPDADRDGGTPTLIVGVQEATDILVFAIDAAGMPGALLRKQNLATGIEVVGLAADPSGCGLVVMDWSSHAARVLPWPLTREFLRRYN